MMFAIFSFSWSGEMDTKIGFENFQTLIKIISQSLVPALLLHICCHRHAHRTQSLSGKAGTKYSVRLGDFGWVKEHMKTHQWLLELIYKGILNTFQEGVLWQLKWHRIGMAICVRQSSGCLQTFYHFYVLHAPKSWPSPRDYDGHWLMPLTFL